MVSLLVDALVVLEMFETQFGRNTGELEAPPVRYAPIHLSPGLDGGPSQLGGLMSGALGQRS